MSIIDLFSEAIEIPDPDDRLAFLDRACGGDDERRRQVVQMLEQYYDPKTFMNQPAIGPSCGDTVDGSDVIPSENPGDIIGSYKLLERIGEGGMGIIYMAEQQAPVVRRVALKIIKWGMDTKQVIARFEAERQALALMNHPNIARIFDAGSTSTGRSYFVMELVQGLAITEFCNRYQFDLRQRLEIFSQVCSAVQHAHQKGVIHRDIKPSNVLVTRIDDQAVPKVIDFGIAKATQQRLTEKTLFTNFHLFIGTPAYMSPEQAQIGAHDIDTRSDIYSLGVLLYELLTGMTPFSNEELMSGGYDEIRRRVRESEPLIPSKKLSSLSLPERTEVAKHQRVAPTTLDRSLRGELDWIIMKALDKDRTRRFDTANSLRLDIDRYLNNEPVSAVAPSAWYQFQKLARRNKTALAVAAIFIVTLTLSTIVSLSGWIQAEHRQEEARLNLYVADMSNVHNAILRNGDISRTRGHLVKHIPTSSAEDDYRGFEWRYLWGLSDPSYGISSDSKALIGHTDMPSANIEFTPDGRFLISGGRDHTAIVWDTNQGKRVHQMEHSRWVDVVGISPDAQFAATLSGNVIRLWNLSHSETTPSVEIPTGPLGPYEASLGRRLLFFNNQEQIAFDLPHQDGETLERAVLYDYQQKKILREIPEAGRCLALSPDNRILVTGARPKGKAIVKFWDLSEQAVLLSTRTNLDAQLVFSTDGGQLFASSKGQVQSWPLRDVLDPNIDLAESLIDGPIGDRKDSISKNGEILVTYKDYWRQIHNLKTEEHATVQEFLGFSPDSSRLVLRTSRTNLLLTPVGSLSKSSIMDDCLIYFCFSPDGQFLAFNRREEPLSLYRASDLGRLRSLRTEVDDDAPIGFSIDGDELITARFTADSCNLRRLEVASGQILEEVLLSGRPRSAGISDDRHFVGVLFDGGSLSIVETKGMTEITQLQVSDFLEGTMDIAFSPDNKWLAVDPDYVSIKLYDTSNWELVETIPIQHNIIGYIDGGRKLLSWTTWGKVFEANLETGEKKVLFSTTGAQSAFAISPDEKTLATAGYNDDSVYLWNLATGRLMATLESKGKTNVLKFSPDGRLLIASNIPHAQYGKDPFGSFKTWRAPTFDEIDAELESGIEN